MREVGEGRDGRRSDLRRWWCNNGKHVAERGRRSFLPHRARVTPRARDCFWEDAISPQSRPPLRASNHEPLIDGMERSTELNDQQTARNVRDIGRPPSCSRAWAELEAISLWTHILHEPRWSIDGTAVFWKTSGRMTALRECSVPRRCIGRFCTL
jgi:hypothetical protein